jgi:long-chain acyl-CoA synthetase
LAKIQITSAAVLKRVIQNTLFHSIFFKKAFSYLVSQGSLDIDHVKFFETLMNKIDCPREQDLSIPSAKRFYVLYGKIFRTIEVPASKMKAA